MWESLSLSRASSISRSTSSSYEWVRLYLSEVARQSSRVRWGILLMSQGGAQWLHRSPRSSVKTDTLGRTRIQRLAQRKETQEA